MSDWHRSILAASQGSEHRHRNFRRQLSEYGTFQNLSRGKIDIWSELEQRKCVLYFSEPQQCRLLPLFLDRATLQQPAPAPWSRGVTLASRKHLRRPALQRPGVRRSAQRPGVRGPPQLIAEVSPVTLRIKDKLYLLPIETVREEDKCTKTL